MTPKVRGGHKRAGWSRDKLSKGSFQDLSADTTSDPKKAKRVVRCSGKVDDDLLEDMHKREADNVALIRIGHLYPFPRELLAAELKRYKATDVVWCQEE